MGGLEVPGLRRPNLPRLPEPEASLWTSEMGLRGETTSLHTDVTSSMMKQPQQATCQLVVALFTKKEESEPARPGGSPMPWYTSLE